MAPCTRERVALAAAVRILGDQSCILNIVSPERSGISYSDVCFHPPVNWQRNHPRPHNKQNTKFQCKDRNNKGCSPCQPRYYDIEGSGKSGYYEDQIYVQPG